jgi:hypothetical protein
VIANLDTLEYKLKKRGFRRDDVLLHDCAVCKEHAVATYVIAGKSGGRDIALCLACGHARSWRSVAGLEQRVLSRYCAARTAATTSAGSGNRIHFFSATLRSPTHTVNSPEPPISSTASTPRFFFSSAATRAALGS